MASGPANNEGPDAAPQLPRQFDFTTSFRTYSTEEWEGLVARDADLARAVDESAEPPPAPRHGPLGESHRLLMAASEGINVTGVAWKLESAESRPRIIYEGTFEESGDPYTACLTALPRCLGKVPSGSRISLLCKQIFGGGAFGETFGEHGYLEKKWKPKFNGRPLEKLISNVMDASNLQVACSKGAIAAAAEELRELMSKAREVSCASDEEYVSEAKQRDLDFKSACNKDPF